MKIGNKIYFSSKRWRYEDIISHNSHYYITGSKECTIYFHRKIGPCYTTPYMMQWARHDKCCRNDGPCYIVSSENQFYWSYIDRYEYKHHPGKKKEWMSEETYWNA